MFNDDVLPNTYLPGLKLPIFPNYVHSLLALIAWAIFASVIDMAYMSMLASSLMTEVPHYTPKQKRLGLFDTLERC